MNHRIATFLAALALAGLCAVPVYAGDGEKEKPTGAEPKDGNKIDVGGCYKDGKEGEAAKKECGDCAQGGKDGKECCQKEAARTDLEVVTLAAVEGTSDAAKKVLAAIPASALEKVEAARKAALEQLARIHAASTELKKDFDDACAEAKAKGVEVACDMKATFDADMKALHAKAKEQVDLCAKTIRESIGEDKVKELSADCRKAGDVVKAAGEKIRAAAAKILEKRAAESKECEDAEGECGEAKECEGKKAEEKKCEEKKAEKKDPQ